MNLEAVKQRVTPAILIAGLVALITQFNLRYNAVSKRLETVKPRVTVAILIAVLVALIIQFNLQYNAVSKRLTDIDAKIDRSVDALTGRFDAMLQQQTAAAAQLVALQNELRYLKARLDRIADRLQMSAVEPNPRSSAIVQPVAAPAGNSPTASRRGNDSRSTMTTGGGGLNPQSFR
jgi:tetrahydromethanopterin S-methyltransferase subunit G